MTALVPAFNTASSKTKRRQSVVGEQLDVLADIYREEVNISVWQRRLPEAVSNAAEHLLLERPHLQISRSVSTKNAYEILVESLGATAEPAALATDVAELADMFCFLFDLKYVGLRLTALDHAMCPRFHVDWVPCRLVTTYQGGATQWLAHDRVDRSKLGSGNGGKPDEQSGLFSDADDIQQIRQGDVALLKGEGWAGNEEAGLVHRSPQLNAGARRLLLTLDFTDQLRESRRH
ncbi:MAG: DUF1826 domain-containing protein [Gammaproteobacteria bacterium]|nr:DUF1826 domain-containing protein [Gammaproteobacteria bacterium]MYE48986.1 DUF1826 domain-containing protein [Gammaproteobacteria bacterium]MYF67047.1 DUF1826 domain-containing protein [Gammaproteobacteria bacterium]MYK36480.1 DUF1826 domain-containing protein [Gammaproteobacteria bacterium]